MFQFHADRQITIPTHNPVYDNTISSNLNTNSEELTLNFDDNDLAQHLTSSKYYTINEYKSISLNNIANNTFLLHLNIRSLNKNFDQLNLLQEHFNSHNSPIIGLTETWLQDPSNSLLNIDSYYLLTNNRQNRIGGGVGMYIPNRLEYSCLKNLTHMTESIEITFY